MQDNLGVAVDVGTTTVALYLADLNTGQTLKTAGGMNAQAAHGADVTSRISYCMQHGHEQLTQLIREQIGKMLWGFGRSDYVRVNEMVVAGNTIMQHLVAGYSPVSMGVSPYTPLSLFGETLPGWSTLPALKKVDIYYTPAISAYVGGDVSAGLLAAGYEQIDVPALFVDVGTNGEIVLKSNGTYYCAATAAGPAFEGSGITSGMTATDGAIDHVWSVGKDSRGADGGNLEYSVVGNARPKGLCGSGLLDLLAALLEAGAVDETGRLVGGDGERVCLPGDAANIYISAEDIRALQLAKAAIAGGIQVLLHYAGLCAKDIKVLTLAGGFGSYLKPESAARIGLFPKALLPVAKAAGNTAGEGAVMALCSKDARIKLEHIRKKCEYIELSSNAFFNDKFVEEMAMT